MVNDFEISTTEKHTAKSSKAEKMGLGNIFKILTPALKKASLNAKRFENSRFLFWLNSALRITSQWVLMEEDRARWLVRHLYAPLVETDRHQSTSTSSTEPLSKPISHVPCNGGCREAGELLSATDPLAPRRAWLLWPATSKSRVACRALIAGTCRNRCLQLRYTRNLRHSSHIRNLPDHVPYFYIPIIVVHM